jgi:hypothetical protein
MKRQGGIWNQLSDRVLLSIKELFPLKHTCPAYVYAVYLNLKI